jgi:hypothetical protein
LPQFNSNEKSLFRQNALKKLHSLDQIESTFQVIKPANWLWILIATCFLSAFGTWGIWGEASTHIAASGIIVSAKQLEQTEKQIKEEIQQRRLKLSALKVLLQKKRELFRKKYLTIGDMEKSENEYLAAKEDFINFSNKGYTNTNMSVFSSADSDTETDLDALVFVNHQEGKKIRVGMEALLIPATLSVFKYGYIQGTVTSVSNYPASKDAIYAYLGNMTLVEEFFAGGAPFMVKIRLEKNALTASGLRWTTRSGAPFSIGSGTSIMAKITNKKGSPLSILLKNDDN